MAKKVIDTVAQAQKKRDQAKVNLDKANKEFNYAMLNLNMVKNRLTETEKQAYIKTGYNGCPKCKGINCNGGLFDADGNQVWQELRCIDCGFEYRDIYTLTDLELL